jgi:hypothetical protein
LKINNNSPFLTAKINQKPHTPFVTFLIAMLVKHVKHTVWWIFFDELQKSNFKRLKICFRSAFFHVASQITIFYHNHSASSKMSARFSYENFVKRKNDEKLNWHFWNSHLLFSFHIHEKLKYDFFFFDVVFILRKFLFSM